MKPFLVGLAVMLAGCGVHDRHDVEFAYSAGYLDGMLCVIQGSTMTLNADKFYEENFK